MKLLEQITIQQDNHKKYIQLFQGDLTEIPKEHSVDILIVSAFPNDYTPTSHSLIGALYRKGVSVFELAKDKEIDLRDNFSCWISKEIPNQNFRKILCFEPLVRGLPAEVVGDIFRSIMPFIFDSPRIKNIAMPLVASGDQNASIDSMFEPLIVAAANWLSIGLPIETIKIVEYNELKANELLNRFRRLKSKIEHFEIEKHTEYKYDLFISYSHNNKDDILFVEKELRRLKPDVKLFIDLRDLNLGSAWQQDIYEAIDNSKRVIAFLSEPYLVSKVCKEEFNIAKFRHSESNEQVLTPVFLYSANLPTYMKLIQYIDCRESDRIKLSNACKQIIACLDQNDVSVGHN